MKVVQNLLIIIFFILFLNCENINYIDINQDSPTLTDPPTLADRRNFLKYLYDVGLKNRYFWYDELNPNASYKDLKYYQTNRYQTTLDAALGFLSDSKYELDRWSTIFHVGSDLNPEGENNKLLPQSFYSTYGFYYGFRYRLKNQSEDELDMRVVYVYPNSPVDKAGLERGDRIISYIAKSADLAGLKFEFNTNEIDATRGNDINQELLLKTLFFSSSGIFKFRKSSGEEKIIEVTRDKLGNHYFLNINKETNQLDQRYAPTLITVTNGENEKKVGYSIYTGFDINSVSDLMNMFNYWYQNNVKDVILDLRYNPGGYVKVARLIASMLINQEDELFTKLDYREINNYSDVETTFAKVDSDYLKGQFGIDESDFPATNINNLGVENLYFLVTQDSASASELLIKGLEVFVNVVVIGTNTHGKGYGSLPERDPTHYYEFVLINFKYYNSQGQGVDFSGIPPTPNFEAEDDIDQNWGNGENLFDLAIQDIKKRMSAVSSGDKLRRSVKFKNNQLYPFAVDPNKFPIEFPYDNKFQ